jgi:thiamine-phosphate pyrophosphorylase
LSDLVLPPGVAGRIYPLLDLDELDRAVPLAAAGARRLQVRHKGAEWGGRFDALLRLSAELKARGVLLVINDRADVAAAVGAGGVHLGQGDLPPGAVRRLVGPACLIGLSCATQEEVERALADPAVDELSIGPVFPTPVKPDAPAVGLELVRRNAGRGKPLAAIGGIDRGTLDAVLDAGADWAAMIRGTREALGA